MWADNLTKNPLIPAGVDILFTIMSGLQILEDITPTPALDVPYDAPKQLNVMAATQPIAPKNDFQC